MKLLSNALRLEPQTPDFQKSLNDLMLSNRSSVVFTDGLLDRSQFDRYTRKGKVEVVELSGSPNHVLETIGSTLSQYNRSLSAVHFLTHGSPGVINLGTAQINPQTIDSLEENLRDWGKSLSGSGDLIFYGCSAAATPEAQQMLKRIAELTKADVAASTDDTGSLNKGGNWTLEFKVGRVQASFELDSFDGVLSDRDSLPFMLIRNESTGRNFMARIAPMNNQSGILIDGAHGPIHSPAHSSVEIPSLSGTAWKPVALADFDGDYISDIVWRNQQTGENMLWSSVKAPIWSWETGASKVSYFGDPKIGLGVISDQNWQVVGAADLTKDGKVDLVWWHKTLGLIHVWEMNGTTVVRSRTNTNFSKAPTAATGWEPVALGDFTRDNKPDILWRNLNQKAASVWVLDGLLLTSHMNPKLPSNAFRASTKIAGMNIGHTNQSGTEEFQYDINDKLFVVEYSPTPTFEGSTPCYPQVLELQIAGAPYYDGTPSQVFPNPYGDSRPFPTNPVLVGTFDQHSPILFEGNLLFVA